MTYRSERVVAASSVAWCCAVAVACFFTACAQSGPTLGTQAKDAGTTDAGRDVTAVDAGQPSTASDAAAVDAGQPNAAPDAQPATEPQIVHQAPHEADGNVTVECLTVSPGIATGREQTDAALCFGLSYGTVFTCVSSTDDIETCMANGLQYVVVWEHDSVASSTPLGMSGRIYDRLGGTYLALVFASPDEGGMYVVDTGNSELDACHSALTDFCSLRGHQ